MCAKCVVFCKNCFMKLKTESKDKNKYMGVMRHSQCFVLLVFWGLALDLYIFCVTGQGWYTRIAWHTRARWESCKFIYLLI